MPVPSGSQTVGPFFRFALHHEQWSDLTTGSPAGEKIRIAGRMLDGDGAPVPDGFVEIRQADAGGSYACADGFTGFGRASTDRDGRYAFTTIRPGAVPSALGAQAPHVVVSIFARGLLKALHTRMYFGDRPSENAADPLLSSIAENARRTLIAERAGEHRPIPEFRFDIVLQGEGETAFIDL
ncbi:MAG: pcaG [Candidatus Eremiobacteraeota bacterium]|nr:pcaG [Candidatus Eremiobacteraeota bacterium]